DQGRCARQSPSVHRISPLILAPSEAAHSPAAFGQPAIPIRLSRILGSARQNKIDDMRVLPRARPLRHSPPPEAPMSPIPTLAGLAAAAYARAGAAVFAGDLRAATGSSEPDRNSHGPDIPWLAAALGALPQDELADPVRHCAGRFPWIIGG